MEAVPLIRMCNIVKRFPGVVANDQVNLALYAGQIHALLGENGSGKSTLMSILSGVYKPTEGTIEVGGEEKKINSPSDALNYGIGIVHQHFRLIESFTVAENIALNKSTGLLIAQDDIIKEIKKLADKYGLQVDPRAYVWQLSVGEKQRVEILRMLYNDSEVLILDEPTAVLTPQETRELFQNLRNMADNGCAVVFISHKLNEVEALADQITVLRNGKVTGCISRKNTNKAQLVEMMIGRDIINTYPKGEDTAKEIVLKIANISALNDMNTLGLDGISFNVRAGEIYGIAGVSGNGQRELAEVIVGLRHKLSGSIEFYGKELTNLSPKEIINEGVSYVPEDRLGMGLVPKLNSCDNVMLKEYDTKFSKGIFLNRERALEETQKIIEEFEVKLGSVYQPVKMMSGGNLQKLLLGREIAANPRLMVVLYPVRGLDIGAIEAVHKLLLQLKTQNTAIILVSEELEEIAKLADRVGVIFSGKVLGEFPVSEMDVEKIGALMAGIVEDGSNQA